MRVFVLALCATVLVSVGCESKKKRHEEMMVQTPLPLDPTQHYDFDGWWTNGTELLRLGTDDSYELYATSNRYRPPLQRGRWSKQNYATLWLEPYSGQSSNRIRVGVERIEGFINIMLPGRDSFVKIDAPPAMMEDRLLGRWVGPAGELHLNATMRYSYSPFGSGSMENAVATIAGHRGTWSLAGDDLILQPDSGAVKAMSWKVNTGDKSMTINAPGGVMVRPNQSG